MTIPYTKVFVGIDVHLKTYAVSVTCDGIKLASLTTPASPLRLIDVLKNKYPSSEIFSAYEAGFSGFNLHRKLSEAGIKNIVVNPASIPLESRSRVKTDIIDSLKLATSLEKRLLRGIRIPSKQEELRREITRTREKLVEDRKRISNRIKMKLYHHGIFQEVEAPAVTEKFLNSVLSMGLPFELGVVIRSLISCWRTYSAQIKELESHLADQADADVELQRIYESVPGVGRISSRVLANELGDMRQFRNERAIFSFVGLTPSEYSSGEKKIQGRITRQGSPRIRHHLVEIAWRAIRKDASLRALYERIKITRGGKRAIVAVARNLIGRMRACLRLSVAYKSVEIAA